MTVQTTSTKSQALGNGVTTDFPFDFELPDASHLIVTSTVIATGVDTTLVLNTDYTIATTSIGNPNGGTVAMSAAPADGTRITMRMVLPMTQLTDLRNQGDFQAETHEDVFDRLARVDQQQQEQLDRSFSLVPTAASGVSLEIPAPVAGRTFKWNATGDGLVTSDTDPDEYANIATEQAGIATAKAGEAVASATDAGEHRTTASRWATKTDGTVVDADTGTDSLDYSAKAYAIGGAVNPAGGSAKDWATKTDAEVVAGQGFGAKKYADDTAAMFAAGASSLAFTPVGDIAATNVQAAIAELDTEAGKLGKAQSFTAAQRVTPVVLTDGATVTPDFSLSNNFTLTLAGNRTLANPTNLVAGQSGVIVITQDATGSRTLAFGSAWKFENGAAPSLTTTAGAVDTLAYYVESATRITAKLLSGVA